MDRLTDETVSLLLHSTIASTTASAGAPRKFRKTGKRGVAVSTVIIALVVISFAVMSLIHST